MRTDPGAGGAATGRAAARGVPRETWGRLRRGVLRGAVVVMGLYVLALAIRLVAAGQLPFPATEPSAYYVSVAQNLVQGEGLVSDAVWSFATPPLVTPKPAFELWLPMSSLVSAAGMAVLGPTFWAAQVAGALLGALVAPLAWAIGRASARVAGLDGRREGAVAIAAGLLAAVLGPLVLASVVPDSYMPYLVFTLVAALLVPRVSGVGEGATDALSPPDVVAGLALGVALGLAYLSRQEVIWLGLTVLVMLGWVLRSRPGAGRLREATTRLWPVLLGGLVVVVPWLMRNAIEFGSPFPGQAIENMFFVRNEDVFAFGERPSAARYLEQGAATVLGNPLVAAWDGFLNVLLLPAFPIGLVGLASLVGMRRSPALRRPTALLALLVSGGLTFCATALLFPVATLWGTFMHASGPLVVGLIVVAALGADAFVARISDVRGWQRQNVILGPIALVAVTALLGSLQLSLLSSQSVANGERYAALADSLASVAGLEGGDVPGTLITDHPMWLADALGRQAVALPDEDLASLSELSRRFDAPWVVVIDERGRYPEALLGETARGCLAGEPLALDDDVEPAWLFRLAEGCVTT